MRKSGTTSSEMNMSTRKQIKTYLGNENFLIDKNLLGKISVDPTFLKRVTDTDSLDWVNPQNDII